MTDTLSRWVDEHRHDRAIAYLIARRTATLAELADAGGTSIERMAADMGGLHDHGIVTKYGNRPESRVRWDWSDRTQHDGHDAPARVQGPTA